MMVLPALLASLGFFLNSATPPQCRGSSAHMQLFPESAMPPSAPAGPDSRSARMARLLENLVECDGGAEEQRILLRAATPLLLEPIVGLTSEPDSVYGDGPVGERLERYREAIDARIAKARGSSSERGRAAAAALELMRDHVLAAAQSHIDAAADGPG